MVDKKRITLNDNTANALGFKVHTPGIDLSRFTKNPVMLHVHDSNKLLGKVEDLQLAGLVMTGEPLFNSKNAFAAEKEQEFNDGFLNASSLGLMMPFEFKQGRDMDASFGYNDDDIVLAACVLAEVTLCPIPQNENALVLYHTGGLQLSADEVKQITLSVTQTTQTTKTNNMDKKILCLMLGIADTSADADITLAIQNMKNENTNLTAQNKALKLAQDKIQVDNIETMVQLAIDQKKITADLKDNYINLAKADFEGIKTILGKMTPVVNLARESAPAATVTDNGEDRSKWTFNDWSQKDPNGLKLMKTSDTINFKALYKKQFGSDPEA